MEKVRFILAMLYFIFLCLFSCHSLRAQGMVYYGGVLSETLPPGSSGGGTALPEGFYFIDLETGDISQWDSSDIDAGTITASSLQSYEGNYSMRVEYNGDRDIKTLFLPEEYLGYEMDTIYVSWWVRFPTPTAANYFGINSFVEIAAMRDGGSSTYPAVLLVDSVSGGYSAQLFCRDDALVYHWDHSQELNVIFQYDTWHNIQLFLTNSVTATCSVWVDDTLKLSVASYDNSNKDFTNWDQGGDSGGSPPAKWLYFVDYNVFDTLKIVY